MPKIRNVLRSCTLLPLAAAVAACDPCSGTLGCERSIIASQGQIVTPGNGHPVAGVEVTFVPHGGRPEDAVHVVSDERGVFMLRMEVPTADGLTGTATVAAPGRKPYWIEDVRLEPVRRGNVRPMEAWAPELFVLDLATVLFRATGRPVPGGTARFRWTGGAEISGEPGPREVNAFGQMWFELKPLSSGVVQGYWEVQVPGTGQTVRSNVYEYPAEHRARLLRYPDIPIGPVLAYRGTLVGPDGAPAEGATVTFVRSGGLALPRDTVHTQSDSEGVFIIHPPLAAELVHGEVLGRLEIHPRAPLAPRMVPDLVLITHEDDDRRDLGVWVLSNAP